MPAIEVEGLHKRYGDHVALAGISFSVDPGEVVGFLGPNGAGKTTTMKILCGFLTQSAGTARVAGFDTVRDSLDVRRHIGYLPENAPIYRDMIVEDYLAFHTDVRGVERSKRRDRIAAAAEAVGLERMLRRPIGELSKGYRQRVGLAQALVHDPPILVLDEPTTGLDPNQIVEIRELIRTIGKEKTVLLSTHILPEVQAVCGRVLIVHRGSIVGFGTPAELEARQRGQGRIVVILREAEGQEAALAALPSVSGIERHAGEGPGTHGFALLSNPSADPRPEIATLAASRGWALLELRREGGSLEGVFRSLTGSAPPPVGDGPAAAPA